MKLNERIVNLLNRIGLYTKSQYEILDEEKELLSEEKDRYIEYSKALEAVITQDNKNDVIIVFGDNAQVRNIHLGENHQLIVSPSARGALIENVSWARENNKAEGVE